MERSYILKDAAVWNGAGFSVSDISVADGLITRISPSTSISQHVFTKRPTRVPVYNLKSLFLFPGFIDVHVHLREPGFVYKETIKTGTSAAARGGFTHVFSMPNTSPAPDCLENINIQLEVIKKDAVVKVTPYAAITKRREGGELSDMEALAPFAAGFSDDGSGVADGSVMLAAMERAKRLNKIIAAHCEDISLVKGGYIHDGIYCKERGHKGICSKSEWGQIERELELVRKTGCSYHICHVSAKESVELIRRAKAEGLDVSCETAPHYLVLDDSCLKEEGSLKMNPPLRGVEDRLALIEGIRDKTIDMIATDHAPHSRQEKSGGLKDAAMGITGLETAFSILYTHLVKTGVIGLDRLIELTRDSPAERFGLSGGLKEGCAADFTAFDLDAKYDIDSSQFLSMGKSTPFEGDKVWGKCVLTCVNGDFVWKDISYTHAYMPVLYD